MNKEEAPSEIFYIQLTLGENLADNGGVAASYLAYKKLHGDKPNQVLQGLENLSPEALLFINFGRVWCRKQRDQTALQLVSSIVFIFYDEMFG